MAWNVRPCGDPSSNFMLMPANGTSSGDALFAMLESYPFSSLKGLQDSRPSGMFGKRPFFTMFEHHEEDIDEKLMECGSPQLHHGEKKRRLTVEQVRSLERSFEVENKLEPERKIQLAQELGLQPRQVAVWFQNRRARWKTKQIERDYDDLKENFDAVVAENQELQAELARLKATLQACKSHGHDIVVKTEEQETSQQQPEIEPSHSQTLHSASMTEEICKKTAGKDFSTCSDVSTGDAGSSPEQASPGDGVHERDNASIDSSHFTESYPEANGDNEQQQLLAQFGHVMKYVEADGSYEPFISDLVFNVEDPSTTYNSLWD